MISINEALLLIEKNVTPSRIYTKKLEEAGGFYLAQNIYSPIDMPLYRQSAMDGYAVKFKDIEQELFLKCTKIIAAGNTDKIELENKTKTNLCRMAVLKTHRTPACQRR